MTMRPRFRTVLGLAACLGASLAGATAAGAVTRGGTMTYGRYADSLLLDRANAVRSWEITQVNEMLTWMEQHALPFACTTNLLDRLDRASLRRFLVKVRFDWLTQAQARWAFRLYFGLSAPPMLDRLLVLTPADFALVRRRTAVSGTTEPADLARLLAAECEGRIGGRRPVGYATRARWPTAAAVGAARRRGSGRASG